MQGRNAFLAVITGGCGAVLWRYALANYISLALFQRPFPLFEAAVATTMAALISHIEAVRRWRMFQKIGLHLIGCVFISARAVFLYVESGTSFWSWDWISSLFAKPVDPVQWLSLTLIIIIMIFFWFGGWFLMRGRHKSQTYYSRLDLGWTFFLLLYVIKLILWKRGGIVIDDPQALPLLVLFVFFSLLTIGSVQHQDRIRKEFMPGYKVIGMVMSFGALLLLVSIGSLLMTLPYLPMAAETGYGLVQTLGRPLLHIFIAILRFIFAPRASRQQPPSSSLGLAPDTSTVIDSEPPWFVDLIAYVSIALISAIALLGCGLLLWFFGRWLWSRSSGVSRPRSEFDWREFLLFLNRIRQSVLHLGITVASIFQRRRKNARFFFGALVRWGRNSGLPRFAWETPLEYSLRLKNRFPSITSEIEAIITVYNRDLYGGLPATGTTLEKARQAWHKIRSPLLLGMRLRSWFKPA